MFSTFNITELSAESENDYAVEVTTSNSKLGLLVTESELRVLGESMVDVADGGVEAMAEGHVSDIAADSSSEAN